MKNTYYTKAFNKQGGHMIKRLFERNKRIFLGLWVVNSFMFLIDAIYPFVIGSVIDGIIEGSWYNLIPLAIMESLYLLLFYVDDCNLNLKIERLAVDEKKVYFESSIKYEISDTIISARIDLIDDIIDFFQLLIPNLCSIGFNIIVAFFCIRIQTNAFCFWVIAIASAVLFIFIVVFENKTFWTIKQFKDTTEEEQKILLDRNANKYHKYLLKIFGYSCTLVRRNYWLISILRFAQFLLVLFVLFTTISIGLTPGTIFTIVTYICMLNEGILGLPDAVVDIKNIIDSQKRIGKNS